MSRDKIDTYTKNSGTYTLFTFFNTGLGFLLTLLLLPIGDKVVVFDLILHVDVQVLLCGELPLSHPGAGLTRARHRELSRVMRDKMICDTQAKLVSWESYGHLPRRAALLDAL